MGSPSAAEQLVERQLATAASTELRTVLSLVWSKPGQQLAPDPTQLQRQAPLKAQIIQIVLRKILTPGRFQRCPMKRAYNSGMRKGVVAQ